MKKGFILIVFLLLITTFNIKTINASLNTASSYVLMDQTTGRVLLSKDMNSKRLIASITKIMTCTLAIESGKLDDIVTVDDTIYRAYGSGIYIEIGEELTLRDLLYGLMLRSGNDAAVMVAKFVAGDISSFVKLMNDKAKEIGMKNTIFVNPSGLDDDGGNYSSSYDMALLTRYAMKYDEYKKIVSTKKYTLKTNKKTYIWHNKNKLLKYDYITGGKTGYTKMAKRTLVTSASINNMDLIVVTIRDSDDWNTHLELYDYAKNNYNSYLVLNKNNFNVIGDTYYNDYSFYIKNNVYIPLKKNEIKSLVNHIVLKKIDNFNDNDVIGKSKIYLDNKLLYGEDIYISKDKDYNHKNNIFSKIRKWFND